MTGFFVEGWFGSGYDGENELIRTGGRDMDYWV